MGKNHHIHHHQDYLPLFETKSVKGRTQFRLFGATIFIAICSIFVYRVSYMPPKEQGPVRSWAWIGLFLSELWFTLYWFITFFIRWNLIYRYTFKDRLSLRSASIYVIKSLYFKAIYVIIYIYTGSAGI